MDTQNQPQQTETTKQTSVTIVDFDIPFGSLVQFLIKLSFAVIPAFIVVFMIMLLVLPILVVILGAVGIMLG